MTDQDRIQALMARLGPATPGVEAVVERSAGSWAVLLADDRAVMLELDPETGGLTLGTAIGVPAPAERREIYEMALLYNTLWRESGGLRFSIGGPGQELTLDVELPAAALDLEVLQGMIGLLARRGAAWAGFVAGGAPPPEPLAGLAMIRG